MSRFTKKCQLKLEQNSLINTPFTILVSIPKTQSTITNDICSIIIITVIQQQKKQNQLPIIPKHTLFQNNGQQYKILRRYHILL